MSKRNLSAWIITFSAVLVGGCPVEPLVCPAGTTPTGGECVADGADAGRDTGVAVDTGRPTVDVGSPDAIVQTDACTPSGMPDVPDAMGLDTNCDGIDGDVNDSVFVAPTGTAGAPGTQAMPLNSITAALTQAEMLDRSWVLVQNGVYSESVTLSAGVSVVGGYGSTWLRTPMHAEVRNPGPVLRAMDISANTLVSQVDFTASNASSGQSSIAAWLVRSSGVRLEDGILRAGDGGAGAGGSTPSAAVSGMPGSAGSRGATGGTCGGVEVASDTMPGMGGTGCGCAGGSGGRGGGRAPGLFFLPATAGFTGFCVGSMVPPGGRAGVSGPGGRGTDGPTGAPGSAGAGAAPLGIFTEAGYAPSGGGMGAAGAVGIAASGGGGGTSDCRTDENCIRSGGAGGGGGGGGCSGQAGVGGAGGGASIALLLWQCRPVLVRVQLQSGDGGAGGRGSEGGPGGMGGPGGAPGEAAAGTCSFGPGASHPGGRGGSGGAGGSGGGGGGGTGGPSIGIVLGPDSDQGAGSSAVSITTGEGGTRGLGGGTAASGENGFFQPTFSIP